MPDSDTHIQILERILDALNKHSSKTVIRSFSPDCVQVHVEVSDRQWLLPVVWKCLSASYRMPVDSFGGCRLSMVLRDIQLVCGRGVAQPGSAPALGAGGHRFKSGLPDQIFELENGQ